MFCQKCGAKAIEGAGFCQKCGAKLVKDEEIQNNPEPMTEPVPKPAETPTPPVEPVSPPSGTPPQSEQMPEQTPPSKDVDQQVEDHADIHNDNNANGNDTDIYALLKGNIGVCSALKSAKRTKKGARLYGKTYRYTVKPDKASATQVKVRSVLSFPFSILYWLLAGALIFTVGLILQELIKYRDGIVLEYYHYPLFSLCCLVAGAVMLIHSFVGRKEKKAVTDYIREIAEPKQICLFERKQPAIFIVRTAIAAVLVVTGIIVLIFHFPEPLKYPNELLFRDAPIERFLDMTQKDIEAEFGEGVLKFQNVVTGDDVYSYDDDDLWEVVYSKKTGKVIYINFWSSDCSYNRKNLGKPWYRVDDILRERNDSDAGYSYRPASSSFGVYGSIHTGFHYSDGVYFGDEIDAEEMLVQQEVVDDDGEKFCDIGVYEMGASDDPDWIHLEPKDYKISLMCDLWGDKLDVSHVSLYTDEWVETMNATLDTSSSVDTPVESTIRFDTEFYSLEFPEYWADLCVYSQWDIDPDSYAKSYGITFYEKQSNDDFGGEGGELFSLALYQGDEYYDFPDYLYLGELTVIRLATYNVVAIFPTDVQFSEAGQENYLRLSEDIDDILASFAPQSDPECEYTPAA